MSLIKSGDYTLSRSRTTDTDVIAVQVKLTDSCLDALDTYLKLSSKLSGHHPTLSCNGKNGRMFIPDQNGGKDFQFLCTTLPEDQGLFECYSIRQSHSHEMMYEGGITTKMSIQATDESYAKTKIKMEKAEEERKESRAKLVNPVSKATKGARSKPKTAPIRPARAIIAPSKPPLPTRKTNYVTTSSNKSYKDRIIHYLAVKPLNKLELLNRLKKDGQANKKDKNALGTILKEVAVMKDNKFYLHKHLYLDIQIDKFPYYTENDKLLVTSNLSEMSSKLSTNSERTSESSSNTSRPASKEINESRTKKSSTVNLSPVSSKKSSHGNNTQHTTPVIRKKRSMREAEVDSSMKQQEKKSKQDNTPLKTDSVNEKSNEIDYRSLYPTIKVAEERDHYKRIFNKDYAEYTRLKERYCDIADLFRDKQKQLESLPENSSKYREITDEIVRKYDEIVQIQSYKEDKRKLSRLYSKLSHLKKQIEEFQKK